jgi:hypothetical protein
MAARLNKRHQQSVKDKIQGSQLINRLQNHALGKTDMSNSQVKAAQILLGKILSDAPKEITGANGGPLIPSTPTINLTLAGPKNG